MPRSYDNSDLLAATKEWLGTCGYHLVDSRGPEGMDQGLDEYLGDRLEIRIVADRGQWFVQIRPRATTTWFTLETWSICVGAPALFHEVPAVWTDEEQLKAIHASWQLAPQLDYLRAHLVDLEGACDPDQLSQTVDCLAGSART